MSDPGPGSSSPPPRKRVDFRKGPVWLQYAIGLAVTGVVVGIVLVLGGPGKPPGWFTAAGPWLGVVWLVAAGILLWSRVRRR